MKQNELTKMVLAGLTVSTVCLGTTAYAADKVIEQDLGEVVVTAERIPSHKMSTPADVTIVTAQEIASNHYRDVAETLQHVNGLVITNGNSNGDETVLINGDDRVVVLVDGQRMNDDQGSMTRASVNLGMIPSIGNIERIEVVKGAGSALYGSDAVGGVINIITKKGQKNESTLDVNTGSGKTHNYELTNQGTDGSLSWFLTAGLQKRSYFNYKASGDSSKRMTNSDYDNNSFSLRLDNKLSDSSSLQLNVMHKIYDGGQAGQPANLYQKRNYNNAGLTWHFKENQSTPGFLRYFNNYKSSKYPSTYSTDNGAYDTRLQGIDYQNGWKLGDNNKLIMGTEWHQSKSSNKDSGYINKKITTQAVYVQDTMKLTDKWFFVPGLRADHHDAFGTHWTPKAAVDYRADRQTKLYASWGRIFKAPTADDMFYVDSYMKGNPKLKPEAGHSETFGISHEFSPKAALDASYFHSELSDAIKWVYDPATYLTNAMNISREQKHGLQLVFTGKPVADWSYDIGYSYVADQTDGKTVLFYQPNGYQLGLHYHKGDWKANILGRMGSGLSENLYGTNRYAIWDFNTSYAPTDQITLYFKINNFTNQVYYLYPKSSYTGYYYPLQGRSFQIGMTVAF